eukprot:2308279-Pleurochrysis_carterae.AAC.1
MAGCGVPCRPIGVREARKRCRRFFESEADCTTRRAASSSSGVGQLMARHSIPTANATSGLVWVEQ